MKSSVCMALLASAAGVAASRPEVVLSPVQPRLPVPTFAERNRTCTVETHGNGTDDSDHVLSAFHSCNNGGHVVFSKDTTYTIGTALNWTWLQSIDIGKFAPTPCWVSSTFKCRDAYLLPWFQEAAQRDTWP